MSPLFARSDVERDAEAKVVPMEKKRFARKGKPFLDLLSELAVQFCICLIENVV